MLEDRNLARRARDGDRAAFGKLIFHHAAAARRIARAITGDPDAADDSVQEGFLSALAKFESYDDSRPFGAWLMKVVANAARDYVRREGVRKTVQLMDDAPSRTLNPLQEIERKEFWKGLDEALMTLPERQRMAIVLFDGEGYSHAEVGEILEVPVGTVRSDVFHGRHTLRTILGEWKNA